MKKRSDEFLNDKTADHEPSKVDTKPHVRYLGFESIEGGRRLTFRVRSNRHEAVDVTFDIPDAVFTGTPGISIQDAAPMAYEKLVEQLATEGTVEPDKLCLTNIDIANYLARHASSHKHPYSFTGQRRQSDIAA